MASLTFVQGTHATLSFTVTTDFGFIDLDNATVTLYLRKGKQPVVELPCLIEDPVAGRCVVGLQPTDLDVVGTYEYQLKVEKDGAIVKNVLGSFYVSESITD